MKLKLFAAVAALAFAAGTGHAAGGMGCCKDGKCCCCEKDEAEARKTGGEDGQHGEHPANGD
jgi:hypothetical protein